MEKRKRKHFWACLCAMAIIISNIMPADIAYAVAVQQETLESQEQNIDSETSEEESPEQLEDSDCEVLEDCVLDEEGVTVFDTWAENAPMAALAEENAPSEKKVVNEIVIFIRFSDESEDIYEQLGGYDYIMSMFDGRDPSLKSYINEYSWGQVEVNTHVWPRNSDGTPVCYVDEHPRSYYLKQSTSNPDGYPTSEKSSRRQTLLKNAIASMGSDFLEQMGIEDEPYNLVFLVPDCGSWNDLLWSHKSYITVNGTRTVYNLITYNTKEKDISRTLAHEFMHSLGYPDLYRYYTDTSANPVSFWSIMGATTASAGHPLVYEKNKYGKWLGEGDAIKTISKSGHYTLGPSTADPEENTLAYKIPVEGLNDQYFVVEYRGHSSSGYDTALKREGLIFYRVDTDLNGNGYGPPDEIYVLRGSNGVSNACYDGSEGKTEFSDFSLYDGTTDLGISVYNIKMEDGYMSFDIEVPYLELQVSKEGPISVADSMELVLSTDSFGESGTHTFRFGTIIDGKEYELSGGYQSKSSITVNMLDILKDKVVGNHTLFVDVKNTSTGKVKRGTISDYVINGVQIAIETDLPSPQIVGTVIKLSAVVKDEAAADSNTYKFVVEKDGKEEALTMDSNYTATWTPKEGGVYTIRYSLTDAYGLTGAQEIQFPIGGDTTAYIFYKKSSWSQAYIHYKIGSGEWTTAPGVKMADTSVEGYSWIYLLEVGSKTATVCFNNGSSTWDNNNDNNYTVKAGVNSFGGTSLKLSSVGISEDSIEGKQCKFTATIKGGIAPYSCDYTVKRKSDESIVEEKSGIILETKSYEISTEVDELGEYVLSVNVKDAYGQTATAEVDFEAEGFTITDIKTSVDFPQLPGTQITLTAKPKNAYTNGETIQRKWIIKNTTTGTVKEEVVSDSDILKWTPEEIGEYEITVNITDNAGETAVYTINYSIVEKIINRATIYYGNSSWSTANIHYQIDAGEWTEVPGVVMEANSEQTGYTWKYVLELGEEIGATVCFNDGNNTWDSKNGANYTVGVGTYGIKNGTIAKLTPVATATPVPTATPEPTVTATPEPTVTVTPEPTVTVTPDLTVTVTPDVTITPEATVEPTLSVTVTPSMTVEPSVTVTPSTIVTPTAVVTPDITVTPTATPKPTATSKPTVTPKPTATSAPTITKAPTVTPDITEVPKITVQPTATEIPMISIEPTAALTITPIPSAEPTAIPTGTGQITLTPTPTIQITVTETPELEGETPKVGTIITDDKTKAEYKVISAGKEKAVEYVGTRTAASNITVPDTIDVGGVRYYVRSIGDYGFKNNKKLITITIGKHVTSIGKSAFQGCTSLQRVKKGINVQKIGDKAFYGCKELTNINMSPKITNVGNYAFYKCTSLKKITLPGRIKKVGTKAFYGCKQLKTITIRTKKLTSKNVGSKAFTGIYSKATIKVPGSKVKTYKKLLRSKGAGSKVKVKKI